MGVRGVTFSNQLLTSEDFAHITKQAINGRDGISKGCLLTYDNDNIYIGSGYFFAASRLIEITNTETIAAPAVVSGSLYCRLVFTIDLSLINSNSEFNQGYFEILANAADYPEAIQEDLEAGGTKFQLPICKFIRTLSSITTFENEFENVGNVAADSTIYVTTSGSDTAGNGTSEKPFKTIQKAINSISRNLNNRTITINVASGTYNEAVEIAGFYGGSLRMSFGAVTIKTLSIFESNVILTGTSLTLNASGNTYGLYTHRGSNAIAQLPITINGSTNGLYTSYGSRFNSNKTVTVNSCTYAVVAIYGAMVFVTDIQGSKNNNGMQAAGGIILYSTVASGLASTAYLTSYGGRIFGGAQTNIPNY